MATNLKVTELDFDDIKTNLKAFLRQQTEFNDYDFDGSGMSVLLDVLAYNTHYNAMNAHFALNEAFLDSAQIRGNVVTRAKLLGYIPRSILSPRASIELVVDVSGKGGTKPTTLTLPRGTKLKALISGEEFQYVVLDNHTTTIDNSLKYTFSNVTLCDLKKCNEVHLLGRGRGRGRGRLLCTLRRGVRHLLLFGLPLDLRRGGPALR